MTWFLQTGKENKNEINNDATRILNLRGDAVEFEEEFDCLAHVSNKIVLLIDPGKVVKAGETNSIVEKIKSLKNKVIFLWMRHEDNEEEDLALKLLDRDEDENDIFEADAEDSHAFKLNVIKKIQEELHWWYVCALFVRDFFGCL